jgi:hypothetical protein
MPDRDEFTRRPRALKALAAMFERMAGGAPPDVVTAETALRKLIASAGGIPSLEPLIAGLECVRQAELFGSFNELDALDRVREIVTAHGNGKLDKVLERCAATAVLMGKIDVPDIIASTIEEAISHFVLDSRRGVIAGLAVRGVVASADQFLRPIRSVVERAAEELSRRPSARKLRLRSPPTSVDIHAELRGVHP